MFKNGRVEIIANDQGNRITPSYVAFTPEGERLIGDAAKNQLTTNPENTVFDVKRMIGREFNDHTVQSDIKHWPFKVSNEGLPLSSCLDSLHNYWHNEVKKKHSMAAATTSELVCLAISGCQQEW